MKLIVEVLKQSWLGEMSFVNGKDSGEWKIFKISHADGPFLIF